MKIAPMFAAAAILALAQAASAQDVGAQDLGAACKRPTPPPAVDGATATMAQMQAGKTAVSDFIAASDAYQTCILNDVETRRRAAKKAMTKFDPAIKAAGEEAIAANQAEKVAVGEGFNASVKAYRAAHPS